MSDEKHYPEEWTDSCGNKRLTCWCGNDLPCSEFKPGIMKESPLTHKEIKTIQILDEFCYQIYISEPQDGEIRRDIHVALRDIIKKHGLEDPTNHNFTNMGYLDE